MIYLIAFQSAALLFQAILLVDIVRVYREVATDRTRQSPAYTEAIGHQLMQHIAAVSPHA